MIQLNNFKAPACFLDRDGVINIEKDYLYKIEDFEWIEGAIDAIQYLENRGFYVFVVTNQSGIARGFYTEEDVIELHNFINLELNQHNTKIDEFFYSPYHPKFNKYLHLSDLRKPNTGMLDAAYTKWQFNKAESFMIGNKDTDVMCAHRFGIRGHLYESGNLLEFIKKVEFEL